MSPTRLAFAFSLAVAAACGGGSSSSSNLAANAANAYCGWLQRCNVDTANVSNFQIAFASNADCVTEFTAYFTPLVPLPGVSTAEINADINILNTANCAAFNANGLALLTSWGGLTAGSACSNDLQCATGRCSATGTTACGSCNGGAAGAACTKQADCQQPLSCIGGTTCGTLLADGSGCTGDGDCLNGFCRNGACATTSTGYAIGTACTETVQCAYPTVCNATSKTCVNSVITYQPIGSSCTPLGTSQCAGGRCDATTNVCTAWLDIGSSCDPSVTTPAHDGCRFACVPTGGSATIGTCEGTSTTGLTCN